MEITLFALITLSLLSNVLIYKLHLNWKKDKYNEEVESKEKAEREKERRIEVQAELDTAYKAYDAHTREITAENKMLKVIIEDLEKTLAKYTEEERIYYSEMDRIDSRAREMSPEELITLRKEAGKKDSYIHDFTGIYILENKTHDKFYIGQSISVLKRAASHFTGDGNEYIYEDYMNGDIWTARLVALSDTSFKSINALEKHFIKYHSSTFNGYNRTIGNAN